MFLLLLLLPLLLGDLFPIEVIFVEGNLDRSLEIQAVYNFLVFDFVGKGFFLIRHVCNHVT